MKKFTDMTYAELIEAKGQPGARNYVASDAKARYKRSHGAKESCAVRECDYSYGPAIQICHIVAVAKFPLTVTLAVINAAQNLVALCSNHHREFDDGVIGESDFE